MHRHSGVDEGWVPPKVHCNLLMSMCCNVSKILHIKVVLWEDNQTDLIGLQTTWISSSIIKLMLNTFTEFVSKTNLNLYNKIWYKELSLLFDLQLQLSLRYILNFFPWHTTLFMHGHIIWPKVTPAIWGPEEDNSAMVRKHNPAIRPDTNLHRTLIHSEAEEGGGFASF